MNVHVQLHESLDDAALRDTLARIVRAVADGWHVWLGPDPEDPSFDRYFTEHAVHREWIEKSYTRALNYPLESERTIVVAEAQAAPPNVLALAKETVLALEAASILLTSPLSLLVENEINDGAFFVRMMAVVDPALVDLFRQPRPPIKFDNGGGKAETLRLVEHRAELAAATGVPLRLLVLVDSDSKWPGHEDRDTLRLNRACLHAGAVLRVLNKRAIENYVPDGVLQSYASECPDLGPSVTFVVGLPPGVRDYYPIRQGVPAADGTVDLPLGPEKSTYDPIVFPTDYRPKLARVMEYFLQSNVILSEADLQGRDCLTEFREVTRWIREEL